MIQSATANGVRSLARALQPTMTNSNPKVATPSDSNS